MCSGADLITRGQDDDGVMLSDHRGCIDGFIMENFSAGDDSAKCDPVACSVDQGWPVEDDDDDDDENKGRRIEHVGSVAQADARGYLQSGDGEVSQTVVI